MAGIEPKGRITRRKFLVMFVVFYFINLLCLLKIIESFEIQAWGSFVIFAVILIVTILVLLYQAIKRLHDIGYDWRYALYLLIPPPLNFIGFIYLTIKEGETGTNKYGVDPRDTDLF
ncbi:membrane protein [Anditalea andensis]|uniref:Membrane protein n=1 Tax=Anditalea andensis TaxID=1048983 RepID=A0A074LL61_9BACT|nr:membrane protein [Anditalea andensis]